MKERQTSGPLLARRFHLVLLHLAEGARSDLEALAARPVRAVHSLRTRLKNLRAILLLLKPRLAKPVRKTANALARSLQEAFSELRDTHMLAALGAKCHARRATAPRENATPLTAARNRKAKAAARRLHRILAEATLQGLGWAELFEEYLRRYRAGRKAMRACARNAGAGDFHAWRRIVKDLFFQSQVFQPLDGMTARRRLAERLADRLGQLNDLRLLHDDAKKSGDKFLLKQIAKKRSALPASIFKAAEKLFHERAREMRRTLARCVKFQPAMAAQAVRQA